MASLPCPFRIAVLMSALLAGCGGSGGSNGSDDGIVRLTYWSSQNPQERELARGLVDAWNTENPAIQVHLQPIPAGQSSEEVLLAAVVAGTTPDLCSNINPSIVSELFAAGGILALDAFPDFDSLAASRFPDELTDQFRSRDGHFYQIPWKTNPIMMLYNVKMFAEAGITRPPETYSEYIAAAERLVVDRNGDGVFDRWMGYRDIRPIWYQRFFDYYSFYIGASGGKTFFDESGLAIDTAASNTVFAFFAELYEKKFLPLTTFQGSAVLTEQIATEFTGPWQIGWLEANASADLEFAFSHLPLPDDYRGPAYTYGDYKNISIFSTTRHPEAAWRFALYLVSKEADLALLDITSQIPVRKDLLADSTFRDFFAENEKARPFAEAVPFTRGTDPTSEFREILDAISQGFEAAALYRVQSPADATRRAVERIRMIQKWNS